MFSATLYREVGRDVQAVAQAPARCRMLGRYLFDLFVLLLTPRKKPR